MVRARARSDGRRQPETWESCSWDRRARARRPEPGNVAKQRPRARVRRCRVPPRRRCWARRRSPVPLGAGGRSIARVPPRRARRREYLPPPLVQTHRRFIDPVEHAPEHGPRGGHQRVADRQRDQQADDRVGSREPGQHADRSGHDPEGGQPVRARVGAVGHERRRADVMPHAHPIERDRLVADEADDACRQDHPDVVGGDRVSQPVDRLERGEGRGGGDHRDDGQPGDVLGTVVAVGVSAVRGPAPEPERDEERDRGEGVGEVVDGVGEQGDRSRQDDDHGLHDRGGGEQPQEVSTSRGRPGRSPAAPRRRCRNARGDVRAVRRVVRRGGRLPSARPGSWAPPDGSQAGEPIQGSMGGSCSSSAATVPGSNRGPHRSTITPSAPIRKSHGSVRTPDASQHVHALAASLTTLFW